MTVSTSTGRAGPYTGNGTTTAFAVTFEFGADSDIKVYIDDTLKTLTTHYTVSGGDGETGTVTFVTAPTAGTTVIIYDDPPITQAVDYTDNDPFPAETHEGALDKLTRLVRRVASQVSRSLHLSDSDSDVTSTELPQPTALSLIGWDADGTGLANYSTEAIVGSIATVDWRTDLFDGDGTETTFTLSRDPGTASNCDVTIAGATQRAVVDYSVSGTTITFTSAPPIGTQNVCVRHGSSLGVYTAGADNVAFLQDGTGAVSTSVGDKLREFVSVKDFGATGDGITNDSAAIATANAAVGASGTLIFPSGTYLIGTDTTLTCNVAFIGNSKCSVSATKTLTLRGAIDAPERPIFDGAGAVSIRGATIKGNWFTTVADHDAVLTLQRPFSDGPAMSGPLLRLLRREDQTQVAAEDNHMEILEVILDQGRDDYISWFDWTRDNTIHLGSQSPGTTTTGALSNVSTTIPVAATSVSVTTTPSRTYTWPDSSGADFAGLVYGNGGATPQKFAWTGRTATSFTGVTWQDPVYASGFNSGSEVIYVGGANRSSPNHHRIRSITTGIMIEGPNGGFLSDAHTLGIVNNTDQVVIRAQLVPAFAQQIFRFEKRDTVSALHAGYNHTNSEALLGTEDADILGLSEKGARINGGLSTEQAFSTLTPGGGSGAAEMLAAYGSQGIRNLKATLNNQVAGRTGVSYASGLYVVRNITDKTHAIFVNTSATASAGFTVLASSGANWSTTYNTGTKEGIAYDGSGNGPFLFSQLTGSKEYAVLCFG